jgi:3-oxoacyl-[acyl-carrier-protein] synthase II
MQFIQLGKVDVMIAGGTESAITEGAIGGFASMKAMSERNDDPLTASRPYDKDRDGFVLGEGAGALVLEEYEHAIARGATIYAELIGSGLSADAYHLTAPHPDGLGAIKVMEYSLKEAGIKPEEVDYINTHGTSTPLGDNTELKAIKHVFGDHAYNLNISSTKSMTGHLLGAAGAIEAIACALAMKHGEVPPTINHYTDYPEIDGKLNLTFKTPQKRYIKVALSNTFGFGGHNAAVLMRKL